MGTEKMGFAVAVIGGLNSPYCLSYNSYDVIIIIIIIIIHGVKLFYLPADAVQYHFSRDW